MQEAGRPHHDRLGEPLVDERKLGVTPKGKPERLATYPGVYVLPRGEHGTVVAMAESNRGRQYAYDPAPGAAGPLKPGGYYPMLNKGSRSYPTYGSQVLLPLTPCRPGATARVLVVGGQGDAGPDHRSLSPGQRTTNTAEILGIDTARPLDAQPKWRAPKGNPGHLAHSRVLCGTTLLAYGTVLVSGGAANRWDDQNRVPVNDAELFGPATETFTPAAKAATDRRTTRPSCSSSTERCSRQKEFTVTVSGATVGKVPGRARLAIVRLGSATHGNDTDQRYVWLPPAGWAATGKDWSITAKALGNPAAAPPGYYQLIAVDAAGTPSPGRMVRATA
ncbi:DUF1929 domain-containing protein [Streptomyces sp. NBC_00144]|uniref:galactose oxidase early set domain-containing protein n=1 Tax=Streptomyces sp. NBC_00144 TaxID=2975665 RepID=UPI003250B80A